MKLALLILVGLVGVVLLLEVILRSLFGFGRPLLYIADPQIGYLLAPNQETRRFGNRIQINQYSMRSPQVNVTRPEQTLRVLLLGDSIANGGWWTDQNDTISVLLQKTLHSNPTHFQTTEVLNASANSWGPRNELAYLKKFGSFDAQVIVLLINTDDLFAIAPTSLPVGHDRNYPDRKPPFALAEVMNRYLIKPSPIPELEAAQQEGGDRVGFNLQAIGDVKTIAAQANAQLILVMTPLLREIGEPGPRDYELKARQRLHDFAQQQQIPYIDVLPLFNTASDPSALYRDHIHLSKLGNQQVTEMMAEKIREVLP